MTKKKLIDLMLESNVRWPDGAEFAAQDKDESQLCFYKELPKRDAGSYWWLGKPMKTERLPELCRNWRQTIVTREQYEKAQEIRDDAGRNSEDEKPSKCIGEFHIDVKLSDIIDQISHHQAESQRHEEAMIGHNDKELSLRDQLNEMLAKVGMKAVDIDTEQQEESNGWPDYCDESGVIVDWDSVPYGAKVECIEANGNWFCVGDVTVIQLDECKDLGPISKLRHGLSSYSGVRNGTYKFRLIK